MKLTKDSFETLTMKIQNTIIANTAQALQMALNHAEAEIKRAFEALKKMPIEFEEELKPEATYIAE